MKLALAVTLALAASSVSAQEVRYSEQVKFGYQVVTLKVTNGDSNCPEFRNAEDQAALYWQLAYEEESWKKEEIAEQIWRCGDPEALRVLAQVREARSDYTGAYARYYLLGEFAKLNAKMHAPEDTVLHKHYIDIHKDVIRVGKLINQKQKELAISQAAELAKDNATNCCQGT